MDSTVPSTAFWSPVPPIPNPNPNPVPVPDPTSSSDLPTTISLLKSLISFANSTLTSISDLLPLSALPPFIPCPFNSAHRMSPESLFRHSLLCSSAPGASLLDLAFLDSLRYPISSQAPAETTFPRSKPDGDLALFFDEPLDGSSSSFFYKGCHGVVAFPQSDASRRTCMLPAFLSSECSDFFVAESSVDEEEKSVRISSILPSEFFSLRREVSAWIHCPLSYSYTVLRVASGLRNADNLRLKRWIIMNSAVSGVVIDAAMRDHMFLLLKLCLKVVEREALCNLELHFRKDEFLRQGGQSFECPKLVGSLNWLASQLSVLYGDRNGNSFAVGMVKESLLCAGSCLMLFKTETDKLRQGGCGSEDGDDVNVNKCETGNLKLGKHCQAGSEGNVSVSQVIAAVSALHERSLLEEKIKFLRFGRPIAKAQLITEHSFISMRSNEERTKRPEYKAVLEHDGLLWQRAQDQGACKEKTKEELLAEERDYKRRRMSYRGKKVKRTRIQVIRDIIDEHMEEIKQAGGIGYGVKASQQVSRTTGFHDLERRGGTIETEADPFFHRKPLHGEYNANSGVHGDVCSKDVSNTDHIMPKPYNKWRHQEDYRKRNNERVWNCGSRNPSHSNDGHPNEKYVDHKVVDYDEHSSKYDRSDQGYSVKSKDHQARSTFTSTSAKIFAEEEHHHASKGSNRHRDRNSVSRRSASVRPNGFEDRYDPRSSHDEYDTAYSDVSAGSNSVRSGRYLGSPDDDKYENEPHKGEIAAKRHKWDHHAK